MSSYYCDHGAYGLTTNRIGLDAPVTWAVPQEGDGTTKDAATASSVASILFNAVPTTGAFTICGLSPSTTGVLSAASVDAAANALANNINAVSTPVGSGVAVGTPQLRNLVYARGPDGGAPSGTCQIMMRVGSASLNHASNSNVAIAHTFDGTAPTLTQFTGGSGGCWGWFINPGALGVSSSVAVMTYGVWMHKPYVSAVQTAADTTHVRTGGGASKVISYTNATNYNSQSISSTGYPGTLLFDTNLVWTADSAVGVLSVEFICDAYQASISILPVAEDGSRNLVAQRRGGFELKRSGNRPTAVIMQTRGSAYIRNVKYTDGATYENAFMFGSASYNTETTVAHENCDYVRTAASTVVPDIANLFNASGSYDHVREFIGCNFDFNISGLSYTGNIVTAINDGANNSARVLFKGCNFTGFAGKYKLGFSNYATWASTAFQLSLIVENCTGVELLSAYAGFQSTSAVHPRDQHRQLVIQNNLLDAVTPGLRVEDSRGIAEWIPSESPTPPTLSSTLLYSGLPWSLRLIWLASVVLTPGRPYRAPPLRMVHQLSAGVRTFTLQLLVPSTVTENIGASFSYVDNTGTARVSKSSTLVSSSASWTNAAAFPTHVAKKLEVTTDYSVAANSEIVCDITLNGTAPASVVAVYVDPEFTVA